MLDETEASTRQYDKAIELVTSNATEILTQDRIPTVYDRHDRNDRSDRRDRGDRNSNTTSTTETTEFFTSDATKLSHVRRDRGSLHQYDRSNRALDV